MLLVCGEALFDVFVGDSNGGAVSLDARVGGSPFNVAVGLARLGCRTGFLAGVSTDTLGQRLVDYLSAEGVTGDYLVRKDNPTTLGMVGLGPDGSPQYTFYNENSADRMLRPSDVPPLGDAILALHVGSFSTVVDPTGATLEGLIVRESGRRFISYDPNVRPRLVPNRDIWREKLERLSHHAHLMKMSDEDFDWLFPGQRPAERARDWLSRGVRLVVMTAGRKGAVSWSEAGEIRIPGEAVAVVDTVGAGDTFQAALLCRLDETGVTADATAIHLGREFVEELMRFAARAATITCSRRGADLPRRSELR